MSTKGTPGFQAPEVLSEEGVSTATDIYSLGCVMIETFTERFLWKKMPLATILTNVVVKKIGPPTEDIEAEDARLLCQDCTKYDPQQRPKTYIVLNRLLAMV